MSERNYWLGFSAFSGIGPMKFKKLISRFGSAKNAWRATKSDLAKSRNLSQANVARFLHSVPLRLRSGSLQSK